MIGKQGGARCRITLQTLNNNYLSDILLTAIILLFYIFHVFFIFFFGGMRMAWWVVCGLNIRMIYNTSFLDSLIFHNYNFLTFTWDLGEPIIFQGVHCIHKLWKVIVIPFTIASLYKAVSWHIFLNIFHKLFYLSYVGMHSFYKLFH